MRFIKRIVATIAVAVVLSMNVGHEGYETHWWWDNVAHFFSGFIIGYLAPDGRERKFYWTLVPIWEAFEWKLATMKLYELHDAIPEGPRSMGYEEWDFDHQVEDTILDSIMGDYGVRTAVRMKAL